MKKYIAILLAFNYLLSFSQTDPDCCFNIPQPLTTFGAQLDSNISISLDSNFSNKSYILNKPIVADLDGDGNNEIISFGASNAAVIANDYGSDNIQIRSMSNPSIIKNIPFISSKANFSNVAVADMDNNLSNGLEIIAIDVNQTVHIFSNITGINGSASLNFVDLPLTNNILPTQSVVPSIANLDSSGRPEFIIGNVVFFWDGFQWLSTRALDGTSGSRDYNTMFNGAGGDPSLSDKIYELPLAIDVLPDPGIELIMGTNIYSFLGGTLTRIYDMNIDITNLSNFNITLKGENISRQILSLHDGFISAGNLDSDPNIEIAINGSIRVDGPQINPSNTYNIVTGIIIIDPLSNALEGFIQASTNTCTNNNGAYSFSGSAVTIADIDPAFPEAEIIYLNTERISVHNLSAGPTSNYETWTTPLFVTDCSGQTGITTYDFNSDGIKELVYRDQTDLRIMYGGTDSAILGSIGTDRNWFIRPNVISPTGVEYPTIVDLDNDGEAEIVTYGSSFNTWPDQVLGNLMVFESAPSTTPWGPASSIWNQAQYFYSNINPNGSVPVNQLNQNTVINGQKPYNLFLGQPNIISNDTIWKPDVNIKILEASCELIKIELCNTCNKDILSGMPVTTYNESPLLQVSASIINQQTTNYVIPKNGGCISLDIPTYGFPGTYYIVVNDNGSSTRPFNLTTDFPNTNIEECGYVDNIANVNVSCPLDPKTDCCKTDLEIYGEQDPFSVQNTFINNTNLSYAEETFTLYQDATIPIKELRVSITDIQFNYNYDQCATCVNNPALWGGIYSSDEHIGTLPNAVSQSNFNMLQSLGDDVDNGNNSREIIWQNSKGAMIKAGDKFKVTYLLPPTSEIPCCATSVRICTKLSWQDANCNICERFTCSNIDLVENITSLKLSQKKKIVVVQR